MRSNVPHAGAGRSDWAMRNWPVVESRLRRAAFSIDTAMPGFNVKRDLERAVRDAADWGAVELRDGDPQANRSFYRGPGIYARPPRGCADQARKRTVKAMKEGRRGKPTTQFQDASGRNRTVPKVVNLDTPRLLLLSKPDATYKSVATPSWDADMEAAAETMRDRMMVELARQLDHALGKIR